MEALVTVPSRRRAIDREELALSVREHVLETARRGGSFAGAALSIVDVLVHLYARVLRVDPAHPKDPDRDHVLLSKGHAVPALYGVLAELEFFERARIARHLSASDAIFWHPSTDVPGVDFRSGSLGHLLAVGVGIALDAKLRVSPKRAFVLLGDGELNEGSIWEAMLVASAHRLDRLVVVIDRNQLQANVATEALVPLEPLRSKLESFGFAVAEVDGHDFASLDRAFEHLPLAGDQPSAIVAHTVRGRGVPSIEARPDKWFVRLDDAAHEALLGELRENARTR